MTTKEFIEMLQKADPSGNAHVRLPSNGVPIFAELKEGYWDGSYQYLEPIDPNKKMTFNNMRLVESTKGMKVDIHTMEIDQIIWDFNGDMDEIEKHIRFEYTYLNNDDRIKPFMKYVREQAEFAKKYDDEYLEKWYKDVLEKYYYDEYGEIRQPLDSKIGHWNRMKFYHLIDGDKILNQGECGILIRTGNFYPEKRDNYYVWLHDPERGKDWTKEKYGD